LVKVASAISESPDSSLPKQQGDWADLKAAYRFLDNERIDPQAIGSVHRAQVREATAAHLRVLLLQDDSDAHGVKMQGLRHIQHSTLAKVPGGPMLGLMQQAWFLRPEPPAKETRAERMQRWRESCVWSDAAQEIGPAPEGVHYVHVADRGSDDMHFMAACEAEGHGFIIRARHDRRVEGPGGKLWAALGAAPALGRMEIRIGQQQANGGKKARRARTAEVEVAAMTVTLMPPWNHPDQHGPRTVQAVHLREINPPDDAEPVDWMLLTSEPAGNFQQARQVVKDYQQRWVIEEWHRVLKEGCRLEASQIESLDNFQRLAALLSIIAVRMLQLRDLADPEQSGQAADDPAALQRTCPEVWIAMVAALAVVDPQKLTPRQFFLTIAKRGGYLNRKRDGRPGWKTLWRGWYDITQMVRGAQLLQKHPPPRCG